MLLSTVAGRDTMQGFAERLKLLRKEAGITQEELAKRSGIHRVVISRLESGTNDPAWSTVKALARALGVTTHAFDDQQDAPAAPKPDAGQQPPAEGPDPTAKKGRR